MRRIIVKEGPLVFLRNVLFMELLAALVLYIVSTLVNFEMLYRGIHLDNILRYDLFLIISFSTFESVYISLLFLDWYFSHFEITDKEITKKSGLLFRHRKSVDLSKIVSVETYHSPLGRIMKHATVILHHDTGNKTKIKNIASPDDYTFIIKQMIKGSDAKALSKSVQTLINEGEGMCLEFKETLRFDVHKNEINKEMERSVLKTIVAFLNTDGGILLIGVNDQSEVRGLEADYKTLPKKNRDGFENHLNMLIKTCVGLPFSKHILTRFERIENKDVCLVSVGKSHRPAFLKVGEKEEFFVRVGNSTHPFSMSETQDYIKSKWK